MTVPLDIDEDALPNATATNPADSVLIERFNRDLVQHAIERLPVHYRETLLLCDVEEMSYRQAAEVLSIPIGTVMSRLSRARKAVRLAVRKCIPDSVHRGWCKPASGKG